MKVIFDGDYYTVLNMFDINGDVIVTLYPYHKIEIAKKFQQWAPAKYLLLSGDVVLFRYDDGDRKWKSLSVNTKEFIDLIME